MLKCFLGFSLCSRSLHNTLRISFSLRIRVVFQITKIRLRTEIKIVSGAHKNHSNTNIFSAEQKKKVLAILRGDRPINNLFCFVRAVAKNNKQKYWKSLVKSFSPFLKPLPVQGYSSECILHCLVQAQLHTIQATDFYLFSWKIFLQPNRSHY